MRLRSLLFVPGDSERKFAKARECHADALILDLEDAVAPQRKEAAREHVASVIGAGGNRDWRLFVRPNALDTTLAIADLAAVVRPGLDAVLLPKVNGAHDVIRVGHYLDAFETAAGMELGTVKIAVVATETARAMFELGSYAPAPPRLIAMTWGAEDLSVAIGSSENKEADGNWTMPFRVARAQCLFAAGAAGVAPIDTLYTDFRDATGLAADCATARRDGFMGRIAIHPEQVKTINACFSPSEDEVAAARAVVAAFAADPNAGVVGIGGKMFDIPHLTQAQRTLAAAEEA